MDGPLGTRALVDGPLGTRAPVDGPLGTRAPVDGPLGTRAPVDGLNCSPAAESGDVVQSCSLGCCVTVSAKCQPQQNTPSTQQGLRVLQENLSSTLFKSG